MKVPFEQKIKLRQESLKTKTHAFCAYYELNGNIEPLCFKLIDLMAQQDDVMFMQGKAKNWASAVIHLVASKNHMFNNLVFNTLRDEDIEEFFNSHCEFYCRLARRIDEKLNISEKEEFHVLPPEDLDANGYFHMNDDGSIIYVQHNGDGHFIC